MEDRYQIPLYIYDEPPEGYSDPHLEKKSKEEKRGFADIDLTIDNDMLIKDNIP